MYADFSTLRLHINEKEDKTLRNALTLLNKMADYIEEETMCKLTVDIGEEDEVVLSSFGECILWGAIENLETILGER